MGKILIGTSSWLDKELVESGFYPPEILTSSERLGFYAGKFEVVELDSFYHFMPSAGVLSFWIEAAPAGFQFDVKAFSLLTQHPATFSSLPRDLREGAGDLLKPGTNLYLHHLPEDLVDRLWERFDAAVFNLYSAGKLGLVTFQFPPWFHPTIENYLYIAECKKRLPRYPLAFEFRARSWLGLERRDYTLSFLKENGLGLVCVDEPQGLSSSLPPIAEVTAPFGVVRFHGRNVMNWERKDIPVSDKYNYLYNEMELREWSLRILGMAERADPVFVIFKNKHRDYSVRNALQMKDLLFQKVRIESGK